MLQPRRLAIVSLVLLFIVSITVTVTSVAGYVPPKNVSIGLCLDVANPTTSTFRAAINFAVMLSNLDQTLTPTTDIIIREIDCGSTNDSAKNASLALLNAGVIGLIGGQTEMQSRGIAEAASIARKPFTAIHYVQPVDVHADAMDTYTLRVSPSEYNQAMAMWDTYTAYLNPTLQQNYPDVDQVHIHIIYSSDDELSQGFLDTLQFHATFIGVSFSTLIDIPSKPANLTATADALQVMIQDATNGKNHTTWVVSPASTLDTLVEAVSQLGVLDRFLWILSEDSLLYAVSTPEHSLTHELTYGMLGLVRGKGYVAQDRMFSPWEYTDIPGNSMNWTGFTTAALGNPLPYPDIYTQYAYDCIEIYVKSLLPLVDVEAEGGVFNQGDVLFSNMLNVTFVGVSGPLAFQPNGDRKSMEFVSVQVNTQDLTHGYTVIGGWNSLMGASWFDRTPPLYDQTIGANSFASKPYERVDQAYSSVGFAYTWNPVPVSSLPPPARYGACIVVSKELDSIFVLGGIAGTSATPMDDVWQLSLATQSWLLRAVSGTKPEARYYPGCTISGDFIYLFGGLGISGIKGDMWKYQVSTNQWINIPLASNIAGRAQRAQFGYTDFQNAGHLAVFGGRHRATVNAEMWKWFVDDETFQVQAIIYKPQSWVQPEQPPYSNDFAVTKVLSGLTAPIAADTTIAGRDVIVIVGGYEWNTTVAFIYEIATNELTPMYTFGPSPGYRSLSQAVIVGGKMFVVRGWDSVIQDNVPTVYTLDVNCPGPTCGLWEYHASLGDGRDSVTANLYGENIINFGGWGSAVVHNDLALVNVLRKDDYTALHADYFGPPGRKMFSSCLIGNQMVIFGGFSADQKVLSDSYVLSVDEQLWSLKAASSLSPTARYGHTASSIRLEMYVFGGTDGNSNMFNDLCVYSLYTSEWTIYTSQMFKPDIVAWPTSRYGHLSWSVSDRYVFIYGGKADDFVTHMTDLWAFDVSSTRFTQVFASHTEPDNVMVSTYYDYESPSEPTPVDFQYVAPLIQSVGIHYGTSFFLFGGMDSGANPNAWCYEYRFPNTSITDVGTWYVLPKLPSARNQHVATLMGDDVYIYGGLYYEAVQNDLLVYNIPTSTWRTVDAGRSWLKPRAMASGMMIAYGNSITMWGGSSAEFNDLHSNFFLIPEIWQYCAGAACTGDNPLVNDEPCTPCTPGTIYSLQWCIPCSAGYYWSNANGVAECVPCLPGFAGSIRGAASFALCIPCANGTYAPQGGMSECTVCANDKYCPVGSAVQLAIPTDRNGPKFYQNQPLAYESSAKRISDDTTVLSYVLISLCAFLVLAYFVITSCRLDGSIKVERLDYLFQYNHLQFKNKAMIRRQTPLGGYCSLIAILLVLYLIITLTLPFSMDNIIETRSLIPNVANTKEISGDLIATGKLNGYSGGCVMPNTANTCVPGITVSIGDGQNFVNALNATWSCQNLTDLTYRAGNSSSASACEVTWTCRECEVPIKDTVTFNYLADNTFASGIEWSFTSTSGYPGQVSRIYGSVMSGDDTLLRGVTTPTNVDLYLTQTLYTESYSSVLSTGYHLNFADRTLGDTTAPINFYSTNGVKLSFSLELQLDTMNIERAQKQTTIQFIGSLLGSISGVIGGVAVLLGKSEDLEDLAFAKSNEFIAKSSRGRLNSLFQENDNRVIERAQKFLIGTHGNPANSAVAFQTRNADTISKSKPAPASSAIHPYRQKQTQEGRTESAKLSSAPMPSPSTVALHRSLNSPAQEKEEHGSNDSTSESDRSHSSSEVRPKSAASTFDDHVTSLPSATRSSRPPTAASTSRNTTRIHTAASPPPLPPALEPTIPPALPPWDSTVHTAESIRNAVSPFAPNSPSDVSPAVVDSYESSEEARAAAFRVLAVEPASSSTRSAALGVLLQLHPPDDESAANHRLQSSQL